ncbi:MAG: hypothetical protein IPL61_06275 [Myxococcales bacterium]|nr:hypothetical protein [Myxococcales bacterium]
MPRLGDILTKLGYCTPEQVQEGLAAQVLYGARLGTNLIELGHIDLDRLARALARRTKLPAALAGHFERRDLAIQSRIPADLAAKLRAVPLGKLAHDSARVAVAVRDRLTEHARGELAYCLDLDPEQIVEAIAPELRLYYHLELAYQIPRANRFLRVDRDRSGVISVPQAPPTAEDTDVDGPSWTAEPGTSPPPMRGQPAASGPVSDIEPAALDYQTAPAVDDEIGRARRRFVPKLGQTQQAALARIAVRQVTTEVGLRPIEERDAPAARTREELLRSIRRAPTRDRVAELVLGTLGDLPRAPLDVAALLVVRQQVAIGWKGYCPEGQAAIEALAFALSGDSAIARCYQAGRVQVTAVAAATTTDVDRELWTVLGGRPPTELAIAPIAIGDQIVCLLYAHGRMEQDDVGALVGELADAAGTAFARLLRAAQR